MKTNTDSRVKAKLFPMKGFIVTLITLALMMTGQMVIMRNHINISEMPTTLIIEVVIYWVIIAVAFLSYTNFQFVRKFQKPMEEFADATKKVTEGDFSIYVAPRHLSDKRDFIDVMFMDFNKMVEELGSIETLKTDFFSNVSHEIKTPLATIQNYAQSLKSADLNEVQQEVYIDTIIESSNRLSDLISNILRINKLEKQNLSPLTEEYDVCAQLCECALRFEDRWESMGIEFEADIEDRAMIDADASLLELVWNNLISNAIKFTETEGRIMLYQTSTADEIIVSVSDTGCGMDEETLKHIFDKFYQGDTSRSTEGNGLGLALVQRILQLMDGNIYVESEKGRGTTFTVRIPVVRNKN